MTTHTVVVVGNSGVGKTTLLTAWAGVARENAYKVMSLAEYLQVSKYNEGYNALVSIRGTPVSFGRVPVFHNEKRSVMQTAQAFVLVFHNGDGGPIPYYVKDIKTNNRHNVPVLLVGMYTDENHRKPNPAVEIAFNALSPSRSHYIVLNKYKVAAKDAEELNRLNSAISALVFGGPTTTTPPGTPFEDDWFQHATPTFPPVPSSHMPPQPMSMLPTFLFLDQTPPIMPQIKSIGPPPSPQPLVARPATSPSQIKPSVGPRASPQPQNKPVGPPPSSSKKLAATQVKGFIDLGVNALWDSLSNVLKATPSSGKVAEEKPLVPTKPFKVPSPPKEVERGYFAAALA